MISSPHDPQDREYYHKYGATKELAFVEFCNAHPSLGLHVMLNPEKQFSPYPNDLMIDGKVVELKYQGTPFFMARRVYDIDPIWAVSFNVADFLNYRRNCRGMDVYFWVHWTHSDKVIHGRHYSVAAHHGIYVMSWERMVVMCQEAKIHRYKDRPEGGPNKLASLGLDVRLMKALYRRLGSPFMGETNVG